MTAGRSKASNRPASNASASDAADRLDADVVIVGAGAAGLATAIFLRTLNPARAVVLLDGAKKPGAKILVSGGSRCNVTNTSVGDADFWGGKRTIIRRVLRAFPVRETIAWFDGMGVPLHAEPGGKLFPDSNKSRDVLNALLREASARGVDLQADHRVVDIERGADGARFRIVTPKGDIRAARVVLATGGRSLPKTGSDGAGFELARKLGHAIVPTTPGLTPLVLDDAESVHRTLSGVSQDVELTLWIDRRAETRIRGAMLWTHFGISGPAALDMSRHWLRATLEERVPALTLNFFAGLSFDAVDRRLTDLASAKPRTSIENALATLIPGSVAAALLERLSIGLGTSLAHFARDDRRRLAQALVAWPLPVTGSRGYAVAEVTAGGIPLGEIDPSTLESRVCPGLHLVGEILDVDGRIGGFNFQWAWSSARVAASALAR